MRQSEAKSDDEETTVEKLHTLSETPQMAGNADNIFSDLDTYFQLHDDGSYDFSAIRANTTYSRNNIYKTFANHGRLTHYTDEVDEPIHDVVRYDEGSGTKANHIKQQRYIRGLIRDYAFVDPHDDGTVNIEPVLEHDDSLTRQRVLTNLAKSTRVLVPSNDRSLSDETASNDSKMQQTLNEIDVASEESFKRGWYERGEWERSPGAE